MVLFNAPLLTNGATHSAQAFRMLIRDLARGNEGITEGPDLKVTQLSTPGSSVQVADGSGIIRGRANVFQGSYSFCNVGSGNVSIAATGASPRSDMVIVRVEDPQYEGTLNPATDPIVYFQVIPNVSASATTIPDGRTGIPLARIDIPASTSTITNAMITDLRKIANPRRETASFNHSPTSLSAEITGSSNVYSYFSTEPGWNIPVPTWASRARIRINIWGMRLTTANFFGAARALWGSSGLVVQAVTIDDNGGAALRRIPHGIADTLTIPDTYRGTSQLLRVQAAGASGNTGRVSVDGSSTFAYDIEFEEAPR